MFWGRWWILGFLFISLLAGFLIGVAGYSFALIGHFVFQKNLPHAKRPHFSLICDFLMLSLYIFKRSDLNAQLQRTNT